MPLRCGRPAKERLAHDLSSLRILFHVAAPCPPHLKRAFLDWLGPARVHELYGGTEGNGACYITGTEWLEKPGSVGRFMPGSEGRILSDGILSAAGVELGDELPRGEAGVVYMRLTDEHPTYHEQGGTAYRYLGSEP